MKKQMHRGLVILASAFLAVQLLGTLNQPAESARRYQYKVITMTGMTELRTQSNAQQGRMATIEKVINDQADQGWELFQADGYMLYFRR